MHEASAHDPQPADAAARAIALVDVAERLSEILREETAAVRGHAPGAGVAALAAEKQALLQSYEALARALQGDLQGGAALPDDLRERMKQRNDDLAHSCAENAQALRRHLAAQQALVELIAVAHTRNQRTGYGAPPAGGAGYGRATQVRAVAAALDTRL